LVKVNGVDCHHSPLSETGEGAYHNLAAGSKRDGTVKFDRRFRFFFTYPSRPEGCRRLSVGFAPRHYIDLTLPGLQNGNCEACRTPKPEEPNPLAGLHAGNAKTTEADNTRTEEGCDLYIVQTGVQRKHKVRSREDTLGETSIYGIPGESGMIAQIFAAMPAIPAIAVHTTHPGDADSCALRQLVCFAFDDLPHDLMTGYELRLLRREISFDYVQVRTTNPARNDAKQYVPRLNRRTGYVPDLKKRVSG
jgi:hypothetical protein